MAYTRYDRKYYLDPEIEDLKYQKLEFIPKILTICLIVLVVVFVGITAIALTAGNRSPGSNLRHADPTPQKLINKSRRAGERLDAFTKLGQLRISTKAQEAEGEGSTVVVSPWFSYPEGDTALFEELSQKERQTKAIISEYFSLHTRQELLLIGEAQIKDELLTQINASLVLGKIRGIYFDQYLFFD